jgi:hypothetical protein
MAEVILWVMWKVVAAAAVAVAVAEWGAVGGEEAVGRAVVVSEAAAMVQAAPKEVVALEASEVVG